MLQSDPAPHPTSRPGPGVSLIGLSPFISVGQTTAPPHLHLCPSPCPNLGLIPLPTTDLSPDATCHWPIFRLPSFHFLNLVGGRWDLRWPSLSVQSFTRPAVASSL
ncbi:unnamed protein product [Choristocarpus tenellus]